MLAIQCRSSRTNTVSDSPCSGGEGGVVHVPVKGWTGRHQGDCKPRALGVQKWKVAVHCFLVAKRQKGAKFDATVCCASSQAKSFIGCVIFQANCFVLDLFSSVTQTLVRLVRDRAKQHRKHWPTRHGVCVPGVSFQKGEHPLFIIYFPNLISSKRYGRHDPSEKSALRTFKLREERKTRRGICSGCWLSLQTGIISCGTQADCCVYSVIAIRIFTCSNLVNWRLMKPNQAYSFPCR